MEAKDKVVIRSGAEYDHLLPKPDFKEITVKKNADVEHTVAFIPKVVQDTRWQTVKLAKLLKGKTLYDTCSNIWHFTKNHIAYHKDEDGVEQVRSPARAWADRGVDKTGRKGADGIDCDCLTVWITSLLANCYHTEKVILRITKYEYRSYYQHIYPVVLAPQGEIIMDCVVDRFNYQEPYTAKKDTIMNLNYLNGITDDEPPDSIDTSDELHEQDELNEDGLGFSFKSLQRGLKKISINNAKKAAKQISINNAKKVLKQVSINNVKKELKKIQLKKVVNALNFLNPATMLLRLGFLASMKLNVFGVARSLRWAYLAADAARKMGADMGRFAHYRNTLKKAEDIFFGAGGQVGDLRAAILQGKGNYDGAVAGLEGLSNDEILEMPITGVLGDEILEREGLNGVGELGELATVTALAAASGVIGTIAAILKSIGPLFTGKKDDDTGQTGEDKGTSIQQAIAAMPNITSTITNAIPNVPALPNVQNLIPTPGAMPQLPQVTPIAPPPITLPQVPNIPVTTNVQMPQSTTPAPSPPASSTPQTAAPQTQEAKGFWEENKSWVKPVGIGVAAVSALAIFYKMMTGSSHKTVGSTAGLGGVKDKPQTKTKQKSKQKLSIIPLKD